MPIAPDLADSIMDTMLERAFLALHTADPGTVGANEVRGGAYRRQPIGLSPSQQGIRHNTGVVAFPMLPATGVTHVALWDAQEDGKLLWTARLDTPRQSGPNDTIFFEEEALEFGLATVEVE